MARRVVVTGRGAVTPVGIGVGPFFEALSAGKSGISRITRFDPSDYPSQIAGQVDDFSFEGIIDAKPAARMDRISQMAIVACQQAVDDSGLSVDDESSWRVGVNVASGIGGLDTQTKEQDIMRERGPRRVSPLCIPMMIINITAGMVAIRFKYRGPNLCTVTACASAAHAMGEALDIIRVGRADAMLVCGSEAAVSPLSVAGFGSMKALSRRNDAPEQASRPFDADRDGFVIAEGAATLMLEELEYAKARGAKIYAELVGYGATGDAYHITAPDPQGAGAQRAMSDCLKDAGCEPSAVDYINAHGTSTALNDKLETLAIKNLFGDHARKLMISSTKSMTGHLLGAAGAIEALSCIEAISKGLVPPTINQEKPDPECDLDYVPNKAREAKVDLALTNSLGFGGHNATLAFKRFE